MCFKYMLLSLVRILLAMKRLLLFCVTACYGFTLQAQLLTWTPAFPKETDVVTITVDATKGNKGLLGFAGNVYVHIGAITNLSTSPSNWLHAPFTWGSVETAALATTAGTNKWSFTVANPRSFFGLAAGEELRSIAVLFRTGNCTNCQAQRNADGSDMYVPIYKNTLAVRIDQPAKQPKYIPVPEPQTWSIGSNFTVTAVASTASYIKLFHNSTTPFAVLDNTTTLTAVSVVTNAGNQQIIAEAYNGLVATYDTINVFVAGSGSPVASLPAQVRDGINYEVGDTSAILVLRAPGKNTVTVIGEFNNWTPGTADIMNKTPDGKFFWLRVTGLEPGKEYAYQYLVDGSLKIADPYTEKVLDPSDGFISSSTYPNLKPYPAGQTGILSVLQTAAPVYNWDITDFNRSDKKGLVIYELLLRDFVTAHDWKTLTDSISYLKTLGINAIELMPVNEFEGNESWGYNPSFYFAPDKYYGTKNAFKTFIDSCHKNGIAVIMDIALNHSFGQSPMVQLYWDSANNRPAADNPWFNPIAKHPYNVGYDMNHSSVDTKYFFGRVVEHWLKEYKIDGYRFDLSKGFTQNNYCTTSNCNSSTEVTNWSAYDASRVGLWKAYYDTVQNKSNGSYVILEHLSVNQEEKELADYGMLFWGNLNYNYSEASMGYVNNSNFSWGIHTTRGWANPHVVTYMESHDEERIVYKNINYGAASGSYSIKDSTTALKRMELNAAFLFTIPGPKMLWQFGELGYPYSINTCTDGSINNDCRLANKPIRWDYLGDARRKSVYNTYSQLIHLRFHPWYKNLFLSGTISQNVEAPVKWIQVISGDSSKVFVVGNFDITQRTVSVTLPTQGNWFDYLENKIFTATGAVQSITLQPGEFHVFLNRNVNNVATTPVINVPWTGTSLEAKAYPNPFSSTVTIEVTIPQASTLDMEIYNIWGQPVKNTGQRFLAKGVHQLEIKGLFIPDGLYYIKLQTKTSTKTIPVTIQ